MKLKVEESFKIRHKILEHLFKEQEKLSGADCKKRFGSIEPHTKLNIPIDKIHRYHEILKKDDEIEALSSIRLETPSKLITLKIINNA